MLDPLSSTKTSRKWCQRGSNFESFFLSLMSGGRIKIPLLAGHHRPSKETPFKWRFAGMAMMVTLWFLRGSRPVLLRDPKFLWFFKAGLDNLSHPSGSAHAFHSLLSSGTFCQLLITFPISLDLHQIVGPDLNSKSFNFWWLLIKVFWKQSFMIKISQQTAIKHAKLPS